METRHSFISAMTQLSPPWLRRAVGGALMQSLGVPVETESDRNVEGVDIRFPRQGGHPEALSVLAQERRIIRGPGEGPVSFADRLRAWWDSHLTRGGAYALLGQMFPYFRDFLNVPIEVVANSGTRVLLDTAGNITRDSIVWTGDGQYPLKWARTFIMVNMTTTELSVPLLTESGIPVLTESGLPILVEVSIFSLGQAEEDILCAVPVDWNAAHVDEVTLFLLHPGAELWGYRTTTDPGSGASIGTWADDDPTPGQVWQTTDPIVIECVRPQPPDEYALEGVLEPGCYLLEGPLEPGCILIED